MKTKRISQQQAYITRKARESSINSKKIKRKRKFETSSRKKEQGKKKHG